MANPDDDATLDGGAPDASVAANTLSADGASPLNSPGSSDDSADGGLPPGGLPDGSVGQSPVAAAPDNVVSVNVPVQAPGSSVVLSFDPSGPVFPIDEQCTMPTITVTATLQNVTPDPANPAQFAWAATLIYGGTGCAHSLNRQTSHPPMTQAGPSNTWVVPFTAVRGGDLTITVTVTQGPLTLSQTSQNLQVSGTNPSVTALAAAAPANVAFRKLMRLESGLRQFAGPLCPLFSGDNLGGVGICQITRPAPTDDQVWSWKANMAAGYALFQAKESDARGYPGWVRVTEEFAGLIAGYNLLRAEQTPPLLPVPIDLPEFTDEQRQRDTLRCFNGHPLRLHEYRVRLDSKGALVVTLNQGGTRGTASWELVTAQMRSAAYQASKPPVTSGGDLNYVNDVLAQTGF